ncbi:hypothetical protein Zm00014a_015679 [Zea mays]|uniref:Uncharacterized protein n=1 Tax=Zea mays TaxID=4577 RepID=A0A317YEK3_MAIZE|nr:hypothetical protein Zm00014a_015679 [Zea mays]
MDGRILRTSACNSSVPCFLLHKKRLAEVPALAQGFLLQRLQHTQILAFLHHRREPVNNIIEWDKMTNNLSTVIIRHRALRNFFETFKLQRLTLCIGGIVNIELLERIQKQFTDDRYYIWQMRQLAMAYMLLRPVQFMDEDEADLQM